MNIRTQARWMGWSAALVALLLITGCGSSMEDVVEELQTAAEESGGAAIEAIEAVEAPTDFTAVDESGSTMVDQGALAEAMDQFPYRDITAAEAAGLIYMREEEKLAHDLYDAFYAQWELPIFQNIAHSEATHAAAVNVLLDRFALEDPLIGMGMGEFNDPTLQALYDQLLAQGMNSLSGALTAGAAVEEIDIVDLQQRLDQTDHDEIGLVYENLMKGSRNHLRAFVATLESQTGELYAPQYLPPADFDEIVLAPIEQGGGGRMAQNRFGQGNGNGNGNGNGPAGGGMGHGQGMGNMGNGMGMGNMGNGMNGADSGMMARHTAVVDDAYAGLVNPIPADAESLARGEAIYSVNCTVCHGEDGLGDTPAGQVLNPVAAPIAHSSQMLADDYLFWRISEGGSEAPFNSGMPAWGESLSDQDIWDLINYMRALGTAANP